MRVTLINPPHTAIGSRIPKEHLPPLGLLCVGGPLLDAGHQVELLDCEFGPLSTGQIVAKVAASRPDAVLLGHSGSTSAHPAVVDITRAIRAALPDVWIVYGGVFPTYHWREILAAEPQIDVIVRGEGEETAPRLLAALEHLERGEPLEEIAGLAFRRDGAPFAAARAPLVRDLDAHRVAWELIDFSKYSYWGDKRAVVVQFSRGCPHLCNYCGQRGFWTRWRHRDPKKLAAEIAWLHRKHGVEVFNFADENPAAARRPWREFLEALIAENINASLVGSIRADDIVRDADILHLYRKAGFERFLLGMENTDEATLDLVRKGGSTAADREAVRLLRQHGVLSMATWVVGFREETDRDFWRGLRLLLSYDPDQIQTVYATPHRWTPFYRLAGGRRVIQDDIRRWDYKHQVLAVEGMAPWRVMLWVKFIEAVAQLRPRALWRLAACPDPKIRRAMLWYYRIGRRVWLHEVWSFLFRERRLSGGPALAEFWGAPQDAEEEAMASSGGDS
jgi:anaerobic magnesium-protoporphyrin IX monomethyl ester cyclase